MGNYRGEEAYAPFSALLPMVHPNDIVWGGWDISGLNLADAMERAQVGQAAAVAPCMRRLFRLCSSCHRQGTGVGA